MKNLLIAPLMLISSITFAQSGIYHAWLDNKNIKNIFSTDYDSAKTNLTTEDQQKSFVEVEEWSSFRDDCGLIIPVKNYISTGRIETWHFNNGENKRW